MTRIERRIKEREWLKIYFLDVTKSLRSIFQAEKVPPEEQERFAFIQNEVLTSGKHGRWAYISRKRWKNKCGGNYKRYIVQLEDWGQLNSIHSYRTSHDGDSFPKPYWVPRPALATGVCSLEFRRKRLRPPVPNNLPTDDASRYALECLSCLSVATDADFWLPPEPARRKVIKNHCEHIFFKDFSLGYGKESKRLFHRVIMMPKEGRPNLILPFSPLVEYDVKACHPHLLLTLFDDAGERKHYQELIAADVYIEIGKAIGVPQRKRVKKAFMRVVNSERKDLGWYKREPVLKFFGERFPIFTKSVLSVRTDLAISLQNLEAELMVQQLGAYCRTEGLFWIPQHDGWISTVSDGEIICGYARKIISGAVGFPPRFESHRLNREKPNVQREQGA